MLRKFDSFGNRQNRGAIIIYGRENLFDIKIFFRPTNVNSKNFFSKAYAVEIILFVYPT